MDRRKEKLLEVVDVFLSFFAIFPLVVIYWRGTWDVWDAYCQVDCGDATLANNETQCEEITGNWVSTGFGIFICVLLNCVSPLFECEDDRPRTIKYHIGVRAYMYVHAFASLGQWRGVWNLIDAFSSLEWRTNLVGLGVCICIMAVLRLNMFWVSSPWGISNDMDRTVYPATPWFRSKPVMNGWCLYIVDLTLSQVVAVSLVVATWRCLWNVLDGGILPTHPDTSALLTLFLGALWVLLLYLAHHPVCRYLATLDKTTVVRRTAIESICYILINCGILCMWRGFWNLLKKYVLPNPKIGGWTCHVIGCVSLMIIQCFRTTFDNSVPRDGQQVDGRGLAPDMRLVRRYLQWRRSRAPAAHLSPQSVDTNRSLDIAHVWHITDVPDIDSSHSTKSRNGVVFTIDV